MPLQPHPAIALMISAHLLTSFDDTIRNSVQHMRACACCASTAFGLESSHATYVWQPRMPGTNDRALALSPALDYFARTHNQAQADANNVLVCATCRGRPARLGVFVPTMSPEHALSLCETHFSHLHLLSFVNLNFKLTSHAYGYVSGEFCAHGLVQAPLLRASPGIPHHIESPAFATVREHCFSYNYLYQHFLPLLYRTDPLTTIELEKSTWHHIIATAQARDPVTDRHEQRSCDYAALDVFANPNRHSDVLQASLGTITSSADLSPSAPLPAKSRPHHLLYQTMETEVHGRIEQIEHLLCPTFFPQSDGFFKKACRFSFADYLRLRTRQAFTPFTSNRPISFSCAPSVMRTLLW
jgi:hypothetical protein